MSLKDKLKDVKQVDTPRQEVVPVNSVQLDKEEEVLANFYIPKSLRENLKVKSARERIPMKDLVVEALRGYFPDLK